jgi:hypothetical protein
MGNSFSNSTAQSQFADRSLKPKPLSQIIDYIATYYILTMDFNSLKKLAEKEYCDKMVILTSDIIERYFTDMDITYLAQKIKDGKEVNELTNDNVIFFDKSKLDNLDVTSQLKKTRLCIGIAKFYVKIAHVFAAIVMTINPVYMYKDESGDLVKAPLFKKSQIPKNVKRSLYKMGLCENRINSLKRGQDYSTLMDGDDINVRPKVCNVNTRMDGETKTLMDEPGIPELMDLYYDDVYDYSTGEFKGMSENTKRMYMADLELFYKTFTGNSAMPITVRKFSDIQLKDYETAPQCEGPNPAFESTFRGSLRDKLFYDYAANIRDMVKRANENQEALLDIINELFVYTIDPQTQKRTIRINPALTEESLQLVIEKTRAIIIRLYLTCETDFSKGVQLYEAIIESTIVKTLGEQEKNLKLAAAKLYTPTVVPPSAEEQDLLRVAANQVDTQKVGVVIDKDRIAKEEELVRQAKVTNVAPPVLNLQQEQGQGQQPQNIQKQQPIITPLRVEEGIAIDAVEDSIADGIPLVAGALLA